MSQKQNLENIVNAEEFQKVLAMAIVRESLKEYEKKPDNITLSQITDYIGEIVSPEDHDLLKRLESHHAISKINGYQEFYEKDAKESLEKIKEELYKRYKESIDNTIVHIGKDLHENIKNDKKSEKYTEEQKEALYKNNIKETIYLAIGDALLSSELTPKGDSNLARLYAEIKALKENPEKVKELARKEIVKKRPYLKSASSYLEVNQNEWINIKTKHLAKEALKEEKGSFTLDLEKFKKAFDNYETGLDLVYETYKNAQKMAEAQANGAK